MPNQSDCRADSSKNYNLLIKFRYPGGDEIDRQRIAKVENLKYGDVGMSVHLESGNIIDFIAPCSKKSVKFQKTTLTDIIKYEYASKAAFEKAHGSRAVVRKFEEAEKRKHRKTDRIHTSSDGTKRIVYAGVNGKDYVKRKSHNTGKFVYQAV